MQVRFVSLFMVWMSLCLASAARAADKWALLVGVSKYQNSTLITSLNYPAADAKGMAEVLMDPQLGGLPKDHVRLLADAEATRANIIGAVDGFLKPNVKAGDQVIVFLAGHGVAKGIGPDARGYFLSTDVSGVTTAALEASAVSLKELSTRLGQLPAAQFVFFIDACREDPTPGRGLKQNQRSDVFSRSVLVTPQDESHPATVVTFFACGIGQRAYEDPELKHGVFTYWIMDGLRQGPVPEQTDGTVYMNRLSTYATKKVGEWARKTFGSGRGVSLAAAVDDEEETVTQTPEIVAPVDTAAAQAPSPVVLMRVKRKVNQAPINPDPPKLLVSTVPEGAQVLVDGKRAGASPITVDLPDGGEFKARVEMPGYETEERTIRASSGYQLYITMRLQPGSRGVAAVDSQASELYQRALDAEMRQDWEVALSGYNLVRQSDPKFAPAYERQAELQRRRGAAQEAVTTLVDMTKQVPSAHSYSLLARAYVDLAGQSVAMPQKSGEKEGEKPKKRGLGSLGGLFSKKKKQEDTPEQKKVATDANATLALRAADQALKLDSKSAEAHLARGFALVKMDQGGDRQNDAMMEFGTAVLLDPKDAANQYGLGYGRYTFAAYAKNGDTQKAELQRAVSALKEALELRPDYYEAHRELAYCYHLLGDTDAAMREYELATANRGAATDRDEVAGAEVALASLHQQKAQTSQGDEKKAHEQASEGYMGDARETTPNLLRAMAIMNGVGLGTQIVGNMPPQMQTILDPAGAIRSQIGSRVPGTVIPGFRIPIPGL
jgi:uncharacterized caspase-like protein/tetratricopeptide (TPR) repeat protein